MIYEFSSVRHKHVVDQCVRALSQPYIRERYNGDEDGMTTRSSYHQSDQLLTTLVVYDYRVYVFLQETTL